MHMQDTGRHAGVVQPVGKSAAGFAARVALAQELLEDFAGATTTSADVLERHHRFDGAAQSTTTRFVSETA